MLQLTDHNIIQFISPVMYAILIPVILCFGRAELKKLFLIFLLASLGCSLSSLLTNLQLSYEQVVIWKALVPLFSIWSVVAYAHFAAAFVQKSAKTTAAAGYAWLTVALGLIVFDYYTGGSALMGSPVYKYYGTIINSLTFGNGILMAITAILLIGGLQESTDPEERNRIAYLLAGLCLMFGLGIVWNIVPDKNFSLYHIGYLGNALLITYVLLKYRLLDIQLVMKKWLVYSGVTLCITIAYLALLLGLSNLLRLLSPQLGIPTLAAMVILLACSFNWLRSALDQAVDRLFYGNRYVHRQMLLGFASKMSKFINMKDIADAVLPPLTKAIRARQVTLLLPGNTHYAGRFAARLTGGEQNIRIKLHRDSPLIHWLEEEGKPLLCDSIEDYPDFDKIATEERTAINAAQIELLCPMLSKRRLVGILALGKKHARGYYSRDDVDLVATLSDEAAVAIENAQIYAEAQEKADTDELTGLRNHRYFQQRLNEEIDKCCQSEDVFSLLFMDLDFFKTYNDIYGHVLGDEILKETGQVIRDSIRYVDIGARYGGDEFAIILLQTHLDGAVVLAERIRQQFALLMTGKGIPLTCSIGIASWRTDGVTREKLIQAADSALYHAKRTGGNRLYVARDLPVVESGQACPTAKPTSSAEITSIVYALAATVDARDHYTYGHSTNVSQYAREIAEAIGYSKDAIERVRAAALLHDIGKLNLPDELFTKSGRLSDEDWEMIRHHPELGVSILKFIVGLQGCLDAVLFHHERYDGKGYPRGLKGKNIPLDARIMAVADTYDALTSERPYRHSKLSPEEAIIELERCAGTQFDPEIVKVFAKSQAQRLLVAAGIDER